MSADKHTLDQLRIDRTSAPQGRMVPVILICLLLLAGAGAGAYWWINRPSPITVRTFIARESAAGNQTATLLNASGYVTARREATVSSKVTGKVIEVLVEEGMKVESGQALARLDAVNVEKGLELAQAQQDASLRSLDETKANLAQAERDLERTTQLAANGAVSQSDLDVAATLVKALKARLERQQADIRVAEHEVALWKQQLDDTIIRAPFAGVVTSKNAQPGEMISPMSSGGFTRTGICTIVDMSSLEIEVDVSESYINRVEPGQRVIATLDAYSDWRIPAKVIAIIPTADRQKATVKVRVGFEEIDARVLPDMGVKVAFQSAENTAPATGKAAARREIVVPRAAVKSLEGRDIVWLVSGGRAERRAVTLGVVNDANAGIAAGLSDGDKIVIESSSALADGAIITEASP